jgi:hypothetical protein
MQAKRQPCLIGLEQEVAVGFFLDSVILLRLVASGVPLLAREVDTRSAMQH